MIKFEQVAYPYSRNELLSCGGAFNLNKNQEQILDSLSKMSIHLSKDSKYGFLEPKKTVVPEFNPDKGHSVLSNQRG